MNPTPTTTEPTTVTVAGRTYTAEVLTDNPEGFIARLINSSGNTACHVRKDPGNGRRFAWTPPGVNRPRGANTEEFHQATAHLEEPANQPKA